MMRLRGTPMASRMPISRRRSPTIMVRMPMMLKPAMRMIMPSSRAMMIFSSLIHWKRLAFRAIQSVA